MLTTYSPWFQVIVDYLQHIKKCAQNNTRSYSLDPNGANRAYCIAMLLSKLNLTYSSRVSTGCLRKLSPLTLTYEN